MLSNRPLSVKPAEIISRPSAPGLNLSLRELLDGLDASELPEAREDRVGINELGEGTPAFSDRLMPATAPAERAWDDSGDRSSAVERMEGLLAIGAGGATAPSLVLSVPSFDPRPAGRHTGPGGLTSLLNTTPNFIEVREAADGSWPPEDFSSSPSDAFRRRCSGRLGHHCRGFDERGLRVAHCRLGIEPVRSRDARACRCVRSRADRGPRRADWTLGRVPGAGIQA